MPNHSISHQSKNLVNIYDLLLVSVIFFLTTENDLHTMKPERPIELIPIFTENCGAQCYKMLICIYIDFNRFHADLIYTEFVIHNTYMFSYIHAYCFKSLVINVLQSEETVFAIHVDTV